VDAVDIGLSPRLTPSRIDAIVSDFTGPLSEPALWAADILLGAVPEYPEGAVGGLKYLKEDVAAAAATKTSVFGIADGWLLSGTRTTGGWDMARNVPSDVSLGDGKWLSCRMYNLTSIVAAKRAEKKSLHGKT